jgi:hypothetical protein
MIPQLTPTHLFSAFWPRRAMGAGSQGRPEAAANARAVAISMEAEEDRPAPSGTSPATTPSKPLRTCPAPCSAQAVPFRYSIQLSLSFLPSLPSSNSRVSSKSRDVATTRPSERGRSAIQAARSIAIGKTKPSL